LPFCAVTLHAAIPPPLASLGGPEGFPARLCARRLELGMTQRDLAAQLGVSQHGVSYWERGVKFPLGRLHGKLLAFVQGNA